MKLYLDASALVKRYIEEPGRAALVRAMDDASIWFVCRFGFVEIHRAVRIAGGESILATLEEEWLRFQLVEIDQDLVESAAELSRKHTLESLDAIHLAAALTLPSEDLYFVTWDTQLHRAVQAEGLPVIPESI